MVKFEIAIPLASNKYLVAENTPFKISLPIIGQEFRFLVKIIPPGFLSRIVFRFWQNKLHCAN